MPKAWVRNWVGGRVALVGRPPKQREVFYIRKRVGGVRREIALDVPTEPLAEVEYGLFLRDPAGYQTITQRAADTLRDDSQGAVRLDDTTLDAFLEWCDGQVARGDLTQAYRDQTLEPYLLQWAKALAGRDLHRVKLGDLQAQLKVWKRARHKRITALKAFSRWAREEKDPPKLRRKEDPTLDLKTPPVIPAKSVHAKGYSLEFVQQVYESLISQAARDSICLRAKLGLHDTEIARIASGEGVLRRISDPSGIEGVVVFAHLKKGKVHAVSCDAQTFAAATRLQQRGSAVTRNAMRFMLGRVAIRRHGCGGVTTKRVNKKGETIWETKPCKECKPLQPNELRHSFATWATTVGEEVHAKNQRGVDLQKVAEHMGHLSKRTAAVFYVGDRVPMLIRLPLKLEHENDPIAIVPRADARPGRPAR